MQGFASLKDTYVHAKNTRKPPAGMKTFMSDKNSAFSGGMSESYTGNV